MQMAPGALPGLSLSTRAAASRLPLPVTRPASHKAIVAFWGGTSLHVKSSPARFQFEIVRGSWEMCQSLLLQLN